MAGAVEMKQEEEVRVGGNNNHKCCLSENHKRDNNWPGRQARGLDWPKYCARTEFFFPDMASEVVGIIS